MLRHHVGHVLGTSCGVVLHGPLYIVRVEGSFLLTSRLLRKNAAFLNTVRHCFRVMISKRKWEGMCFVGFVYLGGEVLWRKASPSSPNFMFFGVYEAFVETFVLIIVDGSCQVFMLVVRFFYCLALGNSQTSNLTACVGPVGFIGQSGQIILTICATI